MTSSQRRSETLLVLVALLALALNLRIAAVAVSPQLDPIRSDLAMSGAAAGLLTSLPVICFASFGIVAPLLSSRIGLHRASALGLVAIIVGQAGRALSGDQVGFLLLSALALAGMAVGNVLLPTLVKQHFPGQIGQVTAWYTTSLTLGLTMASLLTTPLSDQLGGWRPGLASWAVLALICLLPWLGILGKDRRIGPPASTIALTAVARTRIGRSMGIFFGFQSMNAYALFGWLPSIFTSAGYSPAFSGALLAVLAGISIPLAMACSSWTARHPSPYGLIVLIGVFAIAGDLGLLFAPTAAPVAWAVLLGFGNSAFPVFLALVGHRARTSAGINALSAFSQGAGYAIALIGPLGVGLLHDQTGGWTWPLLFMIVIAVLFTWSGLLAARPRTVEDELGLVATSERG